MASIWCFIAGKSVGVMGDSRSYELTISVRAITSNDGMTADIFYFKEEFLKSYQVELLEK